MFGLVKKSLLVEAHQEIEDLRRELSKINETLNSPEQKKISRIIKSEKEMSILRSENEEAINQSKKELADIEIEITTAKKEAEDIIKQAEYLFEEELDKAQKERITIITEAEHKRLEILTKAESEASIKKENTLLSLNEDTDKLKEKIELLKKEEVSLKNITGNLKSDLKNMELEKENYDLISTITPYEYLINEPASEEIKTSLITVKEKQKELIKRGEAYEIVENITWNNSVTKGRAAQNRHGKFLITAFNSEVDNIIASTTARNFATNAKKIENWFMKVNKSGDDSYIELNRKLLFLRLEEHRYAFEFRYKKEMETEEQRYLRESLREEAKVKKEIENFVSAREKEEKSYQKELDVALKEAKTANQEEVDKLNAHIEELKIKLERATTEKERALSMAQLTRSGYVYIISNRGSFGENVYKIGMTRRLEPMDRVKELGDASVPFFFDVHALIPSDDAPTLEKKLHARFEYHRVNKVNQRREFFNITFDEIEEALNEFVEDDFNLVRNVPAEQYEESKCLEQKEEVNA